MIICREIMHSWRVISRDFRIRFRSKLWVSIRCSLSKWKELLRDYLPSATRLLWLRLSRTFWRIRSMSGKLQDNLSVGSRSLSASWGRSYGIGMSVISWSKWTSGLRASRKRKADKSICGEFVQVSLVSFQITWINPNISWCLQTIWDHRRVFGTSCRKRTCILPNTATWGQEGLWMHPSIDDFAYFIMYQYKLDWINQNNHRYSILHLS